MPWIDSHTVLIRHRKLIALANDLRLKPVYALGHLHALWYAAIEQQEDGDLSVWTDTFIAVQSHFSGSAPQWVSLLRKHRWLDGKLVHDWLDYAGPYLKSKYHSSNQQRLVEIWAKHGRIYRPPKGDPPRLDNPDNLPKKPPGAAVDKSKPGKKLSAIIKPVSDRLYNSNPERFKNLVKWIWKREKDGYEDMDIAASLVALEDREKKLGPVGDWWAWLDGTGSDGMKAIDRKRTERLQAESAKYKGRPTSIANIFEEIIERSRRGK